MCQVISFSSKMRHDRKRLGTAGLFSHNHKISAFCLQETKNWQHQQIVKKTNGLFKRLKKSKSFPAPIAHRAAPISVSIALGHASANAVKATARGWSTDSSAGLTFPFHSHMSSARRESSEQ